MRIRLVLAFLLLACLAACEVAPWREQPPPWTAATFTDAEDARVLFADGSELVLARPRLEGEGGPALLLGECDGCIQSVRLQLVRRLETRHTETLRVIANAVVITAVVVGVVALCACSGSGGLGGLNFGSCGSSPDTDAGGAATRPRQPIERCSRPAH